MIYRNNKKAQVADTVTWVVATLIIVVILSISIFVVTVTLDNSEESFVSQDKQQDFLATKSVVNFLGKNSEIIENDGINKNYNNLDLKLRPFLGKLLVVGGIGGWNVEVLSEGLGINTINTVELDSEIYQGLDEGFVSYYGMDFELGEKVLLRFFESCTNKEEGLFAKC